MSSNSQDNTPTSSDIHNHHRRGSIPPGTSPATSLFQRRSSIAATAAPPPIFSSPATATAIAGNGETHHRRRLSVSASLGLAASPSSPSFIFRRSSMSTNSNSDSIDETAVDDDERNSPSTPLTARRMSFNTQALRSFRGSAPGTSPVTTDQGAFDWSKQLRERARSSVNGTRSAFGTSPPRELAAQTPTNPKPIEMPTPPTQPVRAKPEPRPKLDVYQERILKGDFYMD